MNSTWCPRSWSRWCAVRALPAAAMPLSAWAVSCCVSPACARTGATAGHLLRSTRNPARSDPGELSAMLLLAVPAALHRWFPHRCVPCYGLLHLAPVLSLCNPCLQSAVALMTASGRTSPHSRAETASSVTKANKSCAAVHQRVADHEHRSSAPGLQPQRTISSQSGGSLRAHSPLASTHSAPSPGA